ncbi:TPA: hypothetical protein ACGOW8_001902 [Streptococcus suis]
MIHTIQVMYSFVAAIAIVILFICSKVDIGHIQSTFDWNDVRI